MVFTAIGHFMSVLHCTQEAYVCFYRNWLQMYESDSDWPRYVPTWVDASSQGIFDGKMLLGGRAKKKVGRNERYSVQWQKSKYRIFKTGCLFFVMQIKHQQSE